jgi:hypothetical protein
MNAETPPRFLSLAFHTRFFPAFLWGRFRSGNRTRPGFNSLLGLYLLLAGSVALVALGIPAGLSHGSIIGWIAGGMGALGILALLVNSVASRWGEPPSYDGFLAGFFFFFLIAGLTAGIFIGTLDHYHLIQGLLTVVAGLVAGYLLGILAGFGLQYLGWLAMALDPLAGVAVVGMLVLDLVLLSGAV